MKGLLLLYLLRPTIATLMCEGSSKDVQLCSSPQIFSQASLVCPGELLTFICTTVGSPLLAWSSSQYVSDRGSPLFFSPEDTVGTSKSSDNGASIGHLTKLNNSDPIILESQLHFNVSDQFNSPQIVCSNIASGVNVTINFNVDRESTSANCRSSTTASVTTTTIRPTNEALTMMELLIIIILGVIIVIILVLACIGITVYCCYYSNPHHCGIAVELEKALLLNTVTTC